MATHRGFGSDNHAGVHPLILQAIADCNQGHAPAYQTDALSEKASLEFHERFPEAQSVAFCFNGTAANVLSLAQIVQPYETVLTSSTAHLEHDECGAPERILGARIRSVETPDGKLTPDRLNPFLIRRGDQHFSQVAAVSITQPTEVGTVYSLDELAALVAFAREHRLRLHMDGARLANAVFHLNSSFAKVVAGFDVVSFGGTKNGLLGGEAVIVQSQNPLQEIKYVRKQLMQLPSKTRFVAAQFLAYFHDDLWRDIAKHSVEKAMELRRGIELKTNWEITQPTQSNAVFAKIPREEIKRRRERSFFYVWNELTYECRLMTSWDTQAEDIERFLA